MITGYKLKLRPDQYTMGLSDCYENIAREIGYPITNNTRYNCTKACVAENIQDAWWKWYEDKAKEKNPYISQADINMNIGMILCMSGLKVDHDLEDNEVMVDSDFAFEEEPNEA